MPDSQRSSAFPFADDVVLMRPWRKADVPANLMLFADPVVQRYSWTLARPYAEADAMAFFVEQTRARLRGEAVSLALADPDDDEDVFGGASLHDINLEEGRAAVGYWLAPRGRGRGVATHAVPLLCGWAFGSLGIARVELICAPDNPASHRVAVRCGFTREGVLRSHTTFKGGRRDSVMFSRLATDVEPR